MTFQRPLLCILIVLIAAAILAAGCTMQATGSSPKAAADAARAQADSAFAAGNYHAAETLYALAQENYTAARDRGFVSVRMTIEFPYNRSAIAQAIAEAYPDVPADRRAGWLNGSMIATMQSDGGTWYYADNVGNMRFHNLD